MFDDGLTLEDDVLVSVGVDVDAYHCEGNGGPKEYLSSKQAVGSIRRKFEMTERRLKTKYIPRLRLGTSI